MATTRAAKSTSGRSGSARGKSSNRTTTKRAAGARTNSRPNTKRTNVKRMNAGGNGMRRNATTRGSKRSVTGSGGRTSSSSSAGNSGQAQMTTNHNRIQQWVEQRGGFPATVSRTGNRNDAGVLRIDYPGYSGAGRLKRISWEEFFQKFDDSNLAFLYQNKTKTGNPSRFSKFVARQRPTRRG